MYAHCSFITHAFVMMKNNVTLSKLSVTHRIEKIIKS